LHVAKIQNLPDFADTKSNESELKVLSGHKIRQPSEKKGSIGESKLAIVGMRRFL